MPRVRRGKKIECARKSKEKVEMTVDTGNSLSLVTLKLAKENALQKRPSATLPSLNLQESRTLNSRRIEIESGDTLWEKGTFLDLYA